MIELTCNHLPSILYCFYSITSSDKRSAELSHSTKTSIMTTKATKAADTQPEDLLALLEQAAENKWQSDEAIAALVRSEHERSERVRQLLITLGAEPTVSAPRQSAAEQSSGWGSDGGVDFSEVDFSDLLRQGQAVLKFLIPWLIIAGLILGALWVVERGKKKDTEGQRSALTIEFPSFAKSAQACEVFPRLAAARSARAQVELTPSVRVVDAMLSLLPEEAGSDAGADKVTLAALDHGASFGSFIEGIPAAVDLDDLFARARETWVYLEDAYMQWKSYVPVEDVVANAEAETAVPEAVCVQTPTGMVCDSSQSSVQSKSRYEYRQTRGLFSRVRLAVRSNQP